VVLARKVIELERFLGRLPSLTVALSGGVDSAALLGIAARALPGRVRAATTRSAAVPAEEIAAASAVARRFGVPHDIVDTDELADPRYRANAGDRCYFCRVAMYGALLDGLDGPIADGLQADDVVTDRPGVRAAAERGILHPLRAAGLGKAEVRRLARGLGLELHDKPAQPCLASRLPIGVTVTEERLAVVHRAEQAVRARGFRVLRVRCEGEHGRIVVGAAELERARAMADELEAAVIRAGFATARVDEQAY